MAVFYLPPLSAVSWHLGRRAGIGFGVLVTSLGALLVLLSAGSIDTEVLLWDAAAQLLFFLFVAVVVSTLASQTVSLRTLAREDPLTGIPNRRAFFGALDRILAGSRRRETAWVLAYLDVDNFKRINDELGHNVGDAVLRKVAHTLREGTRRIDVVARLGGDEFALLLPETDPVEARTAITKLLRLLDDAMAREGWGATFSIGVITFVAPPESVDTAVAMADACMYRVKARGKAGTAFRTWPDQEALELPRGAAAAARMGR
jgi:diguanylate cyclase (GGDEF)-like protein